MAIGNTETQSNTPGTAALGDALRHLQQALQRWRSSGAMQTAIEQSFDADRQARVSDAVDRFLVNESRPDIS